MKRFVAAFGAVMALASMPALAQQAPKDIQALYAKLEKAFNAKDLKGILSTGTSDFKMKQADGSVLDTKTVTAMMKQQFSTPGTMTTKMKIDSCKVAGDKATVVGSMVMKGTMPTPDGKSHKIGGTSTTRDTLVKQGGQWKVKMVETLKEEMTMDGKPFNPGAMAPPPSKAKSPKKGH